MVLVYLILATSALADNQNIDVEQIPKYAEKLDGQALVSYVNERQAYFKAMYSSSLEDSLKLRVMDAQYMSYPKEENIFADVRLEDEIPDDFDARQKWPKCSTIGYIRDQSNCASSWAVSTAEVMSDRACIQSNGTVQVLLSDLDILSCCGMLCGNGCKGGFVFAAFRYINRRGVCTGGRFEEKNVCKPYSLYPCGQHKNQTYYGPCDKELWETPVCRKRCHYRYRKQSYNKDKIYGNSSYYLPNDEELIRQEILKNGPVVATFTLYKDFYFYDGGIYVHTAGTKEGVHSAKVIGWGTENGTDYWLLANSWNTDWGEDGDRRKVSTRYTTISSATTGFFALVFWY